MRTSSALIVGAVALTAGLSLSNPALAIIRRTQVDCKPTLLPGVKTAIPTMDADPEPQQFPEAALGFALTVNVQDSVPGGLMLQKSALDAGEAYGFGLPNGYSSPPPADPTGPWQGLMWPFRDVADGYASPGGGAPGGDSIGTIVPSTATPGLYQIFGVQGRMNYSPTNPNSWARGIPGNGVTDFARLFAFDIISTVPIERPVRIDISEITATMLMRNGDTGQLFEQEFVFPASTLTIIIPSPSGAGLLAVGALSLARRRRR